jgi:hypothetical protein
MKATVVINFKTKWENYFLYTKTVQDDEAPSRWWKGEVDAFITNGGCKGMSKTYRNDNGILKIKDCKREDGKPVISYSQALVKFYPMENNGEFFPHTCIRIIFDGKLYELRPGQQITFGTTDKPVVIVKKF